MVFFICVWHILSASGYVNRLLFPAPKEVLLAIIKWAQSGELLSDLMTSYWRVLVGISVGGTIGISIGIATGRMKLLNALVTPIIQIFRPLPPVAIIPLVIVWLGIGDLAKIFSIGFAVFFPIWINTHGAAEAIPQSYLRCAKLLTTSRWHRFNKVLIPACLPSIISGVRTAIAVAFIMVYVSEIAGASNGLGYRISITHLSYQTDLMIGALFVLAAAGAMADLFFVGIMNRVFPWLVIYKTNND